VFISDKASAPAASAALAISAMSATFGLSLTISGCLAAFLTARVTSSAAAQDVPKDMPPWATLGHEMFSSSISAPDSASISAARAYSATVRPMMFTIIFVSNRFRNGISSLMNASAPGFWSPTALSIPP